MDRNKRRLILRTIVAVFLIAAALGLIGALASRQRAMQPTPTVTSSLGAIPPYADRATATPPVVRAAPGTHSNATDRAATPGAPAPCTPMPTLTTEAGLLATLTNTTNRQGALTAEAGRLASLTATAYPGQNNPGSYATEHPPTPVPTATLAPCP